MTNEQIKNLLYAGLGVSTVLWFFAKENSKYKNKTILFTTLATKVLIVTALGYFTIKEALGLQEDLEA